MTFTATPQRERQLRTMPARELAWREADDGTGVLEGYAAVFDSPSEGLPWVETIDRGAFERTLGESPDVRLLLNHNPDTVMARTSAGTLTLWTDEIGLRFRADQLDLSDPDVQRARAKVKSRSMDQCSFAFWIVPGTVETSTGPDGRMRRHLRELDLDDGDVSVVTYPAYPATSVELRSLERARREGTRVDLASMVSGGNQELVRAAAAIARAQGDTRSVGGWSYYDAWRLLDDAIGRMLGALPGTDDYWRYYVDDVVLPDLVIFWDGRSAANPRRGLFRCSFTIADDGTVELGEIEPVIARTEYLADPAYPDGPIAESGEADADADPEENAGDPAPETRTSDTPSRVTSARSALLRRQAERMLGR